WAADARRCTSGGAAGNRDRSRCCRGSRCSSGRGCSSWRGGGGRTCPCLETTSDMKSGKKHGRIFLSPPHMGELEQKYVAEAFASNWIAPLGPHVEAFQREFAATVGVSHSLATVSGTAAL